MKNKNYKELHDLFINSEECRIWLRKSFNAGENTVSSDGESMLITPKFIQADDMLHKIKSIEGIFPVDFNKNYDIQLDSLKKAVGAAPLVDGYRTKEVSIGKCDACNGYGEVDFDFYHKGKYYNTTQGCPVCGGTGEIYSDERIPTGGKEIDENVAFKVIDSFFSPILMQRLITVANKLKVKTVTLVYNEDNFSQSTFRVGDAYVLLMPLSPTAIDERYNIIEIT